MGRRGRRPTESLHRREELGDGEELRRGVLGHLCSTVRSGPLRDRHADDGATGLDRQVAGGADADVGPQSDRGIRQNIVLPSVSGTVVSKVDPAHNDAVQAFAQVPAAAVLAAVPS